MWDVRRLLAASLVAGALCPFAGAANQSVSPVVVTRDSLALNCSPREVAEVVLRFERALDAGDRKALDRVFASKGGGPPSFQWFSDDDTAIYDRRRLVPYLLHLHGRGVGIRLVGVDVGNSWVAHSVGFSVALLQTGRSPKQVDGKAEIDCVRRRIYVWSVSAGTGVSECPATPQANALRVVLACSRTGRRPTAQELSRDFAVGSSQARLPRRCGPEVVATRITAALRAFDLAGRNAFARNFRRDAFMHPYTDTRPPRYLRGRSEIGTFVARRTARGDGWTAAQLFPPAVAGASTAIYGLTLQVSSPRGGGVNGVKLVIDCRSGLIARWVGPALAEPR
jgi:hypothetical protein